MNVPTITPASVAKPPQPLPKTSPATFLGQKLATFTYHIAATGKAVHSDARIGMTFADKIMMDPALHMVGKNFNAAVDEAVHEARKAGAAQAILQASDGAYYVGTLVDMKNPKNPEWIDKLDGLSGIDVNRVSPALQAVVGKSAWVNFTNDKVTPNFTS